MWRGIRAAFSGTPGNWNPLSSFLIPSCLLCSLASPLHLAICRHTTPPSSVRHGVRRRPRSRSDLAAIWYTPSHARSRLLYHVSLLRNSYLIFRPSMQVHRPLSMLTVRKTVRASGFLMGDKRALSRWTICLRKRIPSRTITSSQITHRKKPPSGDTTIISQWRESIPSCDCLLANRMLGSRTFGE